MLLPAYLVVGKFDVTDKFWDSWLLYFCEILSVCAVEFCRGRSDSSQFSRDVNAKAAFILRANNFQASIFFTHCDNNQLGNGGSIEFGPF